MAINERPIRKLKVSTQLAYVLISTNVLLWAVGVIIGKGVHEEIPLIGLNFWRWIIAVVLAMISLSTLKLR